MKNNFLKITLIFSIIFLLLFSTAFVFLYRSVIDNNQKAEQNTILLQTEINRRNHLVVLNNSLQKVANEKTLLEGHFAKSSDVVSFLDTFGKIGQSVGVTTQIDSVSTSKTDSDLLVELRASGTFEAVYKFLTLLENSPYELDFSGVDLHLATEVNPLVKGVKGSKWEAVFTIKLLSFIP